MPVEYVTPVTAAEFEDLIDGIEWAMHPNQGAAIQDILARLNAIQRGWEQANARLLQVNPTTPPVFSDFAGQWLNQDEALPIDDETFGLWYRLKGSPADFGGQFMYLNNDMQRLEHRAWKGKTEFFEIPQNTFSGSGGAGTTFTSIGTFTFTLKSPAWLLFKHAAIVQNFTGGATQIRWNYQIVSGTGNYSETVLGTLFVTAAATGKQVKLVIPHPILVPAGTVQIQLRINRPNSDAPLSLTDENGFGFTKTGTTSRVEAFYV